MAEFCLDCWNKINGTDDGKRKYILSAELDLGEECSQWKHVIVTERRGRFLNRLRVWMMRRKFKKIPIDRSISR